MMTGEGKVKWNDSMYRAHPTPYQGLAGIVERMRVRAVRRMAEINESNRVLEIGCEAGETLLSLPACKKKLGVDISVAALKDARSKAKNRGVKGVGFVQMDAEQTLAIDKGLFDVIICSEMLEHCTHPEKVVENVAAICTLETRVVLTVPNEGLKLRLKALLKSFRLSHLMLPGIEQDKSEWHLHAFSEESFRKLLQPYFRIEIFRKIVGLHFVCKAALRRC